ncbi:unnamed protein product [Cuscuta campestris]|uniref:Uncharacterized protein n=1 Tax=Cuscuta campestris TaxID=132261 RepID=A0A484M4X4_9ASTE|nr:unnamed protein product [Cuscuta campestris]
MGRAPCCSKEGLKKGPWSTKEDSLLTNYIQQHGEGQWRALPKKAGLLRCGKSCRLRWMNYLRPGIKRGNFTTDEEDLIVRLHSLLGNRWSLIAGRLPGRTDNEIKNYWNTHLVKKLKSSGVEPKPGIGKPIKDSGKRPKKPAHKKKNKKQIKKSGGGVKEERAEEKPHKVYAPKPIRPSVSLSRNSSLDDLSGSVSSCSGENGGAAAAAALAHFIPWHMYELRDGFCDEILNGCEGSPAAAHCDVSGNDGMLDKVYDEYLQLLSENSFLEDDLLGSDL